MSSRKMELTLGSWVEFQHHEGVWALGRASFWPVVLGRSLLHGVPAGKRGVLSAVTQQHRLLGLGLGLREHLFFDRAILVARTISLFPLQIYTKFQAFSQLLPKVRERGKKMKYVTLRNTPLKIDH